MLQSFECPNCQATLDYNSQTEAVTVRCTYCGSTVIVPDSLRKMRGQAAEQPQVLAEIVQLVQNGRKIEAIKLFRETFNVGLKEAKDVVDAIARHEDIHLGGTSFHTQSVDTSAYLSAEPVVQTSSKAGCMIFLFLLGISIFVVAGIVITSSSQGSSVSEIIEEIGSLAGTDLETTAQDNPSVIVTTVESLLNAEGAPEAISETPDFAEVVLQFGGEEGIGPGFFNDTRRLAVDGKGNIYTGDYSGGRIQVFDASGKFLATWNAGEALYMTGMTVSREGIVYVINVNSVEIYDGMSGESLGTLNVPNGVRTYFETAATGPDGSIYFVAKDRLVRLDNSGNIVQDISDPFDNIPDFALTQKDVTIDGAGNIYVLGRETVYKLNAQGQFVDQIGSKGDGDDQFKTAPTALAVDGKGRIFVQSFTGIKVFDANGRYLTTIDSPGVAFDMVVTDQNDLLVMDRNGNEVRRYQLNE